MVRDAKLYGWRGKDKEGLYILKITCGLDSQYRTRIADLMDLFVFNNPEPFEAV